MSADDGSLYRFSVKCDRDTNRRIEREAAKRGMTPTTFVQRHFDQIFATSDAGLGGVPAMSVDRADAEHQRGGIPFPSAPRHDDSDFDNESGRRIQPRRGRPKGSRP